MNGLLASVDVEKYLPMRSISYDTYLSLTRAMKYFLATQEENASCW